MELPRRGSKKITVYGLMRLAYQVDRKCLAVRILPIQKQHHKSNHAENDKQFQLQEWLATGRIHTRHPFLWLLVTLAYHPDFYTIRSVIDSISYNNKYLSFFLALHSMDSSVLEKNRLPSSRLYVPVVVLSTLSVERESAFPSRTGNKNQKSRTFVRRSSKTQSMKVRGGKENRVSSLPPPSTPIIHPAIRIYSLTNLISL